MVRYVLTNEPVARWAVVLQAPRPTAVVVSLPPLETWEVFFFSLLILTEEAKSSVK